MEADGLYHLKFGLDVKADNATHISKGYEETYYSQNEVFYREQGRLPGRSENGLRKEGRMTGLRFCGS